MKHASLKRLAGVTAAAALTLSSVTALAATSDSALVKGGRLNLRESASLTAKVLGQYPTGTLVEITESGDEWCKVSVNGQTGYMLTKYLSRSSQNLTATVKTNSGIGLNLREAPSLSGAIITSVKNGEKVTVLQKSGAWSRISVGGKEGFAATEYLDFGSAPAGGTTNKPQSGKVAIVNNPRDTQVLNLRKEASLDAKVLAYYRNGAKVTILESGSTWHKVQTADGKIGYMMAKYLKATDDSAPFQFYLATLFNANGGRIVNFRSGPSLSSKILKTLPVGTVVTVVEHGADWCKVTVDESTGYISTWFLK
ncbi:MAG: SH3 domain-containing protein [Christensenellaceae bacterium]|nr:SH3 domain-containing protein [Christensenellaceae bacterium]